MSLVISQCVPIFLEVQFITPQFVVVPKSTYLIQTLFNSRGGNIFRVTWGIPYETENYFSCCSNYSN